MLEEVEVKQDEDQAPAWFQRDYEFFMGNCCTVLEEAHDLTFIKPTNGDYCITIILMDVYCKMFVYNYSPHTFNSAISCGDENWVKGFFLLVPHEDQEDPPSSDDLMINPWGLKSEPFPYEIVEKK